MSGKRWKNNCGQLVVEVAGVCEMTRGRVEQLKGDISMVVGTTSSSCPWEKFISRNFVVNGLLFMYYLQQYLILIFQNILVDTGRWPQPHHGLYGGDVEGRKLMEKALVGCWL